jgi:tripartite-type tricarboxylate transporter receptor subunit TctC
MVNRRDFLLKGTALAAFGPAVSAPCLADARFPTRPVTLICPWPAGGGADAQMRALAEGASRHLGQRVVIENRPGAVGTIGAGALASARGDGYLLSQATNAVFRQPFITQTAYDPEKDFTYILGVTGFEFGLVVKADSPWKTIDELIAYARDNPGQVKFGTFGIGSPPHVAMDRIAAARGVRWTHIPFRGTAENIQQLLGGHITASADGTGWAAHVDSGALRLLATFGGKRLSRWPSVPTLKETGFDIVETSPWGIIGPKNMETAVARALHDAFRKAIDEPEFRKVLDTLAQEPMYMSGEEYRAFAMHQIPIQQAIVEKYGLRRAS